MERDTSKHSILGGKVHLYKRPNSSCWQCSTYLAGRNRRKSTNEESLSKAKDIAEDWYRGLVGKQRSGELDGGKKFTEAAKLFLKEYAVMTDGQRSPEYVASHKLRLDTHLIPFFGAIGVNELTSGKAQEYRVWRHSGVSGRGAPARSTLHHEIVTLRQVLKTGHVPN